MCIRDSQDVRAGAVHAVAAGTHRQGLDAQLQVPGGGSQGNIGGCLLYTSDAADERSSVDLGGRRILKKQKTQTHTNTHTTTQRNSSSTT